MQANLIGLDFLYEKYLSTS